MVVLDNLAVTTELPCATGVIAPVLELIVNTDVVAELYEIVPSVPDVSVLLAVALLLVTPYETDVGVVLSQLNVDVYFCTVIVKSFVVAL